MAKSIRSKRKRHFRTLRREKMIAKKRAADAAKDPTMDTASGAAEDAGAEGGAKTDADGSVEMAAVPEPITELPLDADGKLITKTYLKRARYRNQAKRLRKGKGPKW